MRSTLSLLGLLGSIGLMSTAALVACGETVVTNPGTGGQGGTGGAPGTTVATTTATATTTTTTTTTTSTSTGMMSLCDQACTYAASCGIDVCSFVMIDCTNPQTDCPAQCLLDANCVQILSLLSQSPDPALIGCVTACQGGGTGGGGPGGSCQGCAFQSCGMVLQSCDTPECQAWGQCAQGCSDPQCFADCNAQSPGAATYYGDVYDCLCTSCEMDCAMTADPCNQVIPGTGGAGGMGTGGMGMGGTGGMP